MLVSVRPGGKGGGGVGDGGGGAGGVGSGGGVGGGGAGGGQIATTHPCSSGQSSTGNMVQSHWGSKSEFSSYELS